MEGGHTDVGATPRPSLPGIQPARKGSKGWAGSKEAFQPRMSATGPIAVPLAASLQGPRSERGSVILSERRSSGAEGIQALASGSRWRSSLNAGGTSKASHGLEENSNEPVLYLSLGVPAWGVHKSLRLTVTPGSFRRVHQRLERFANDAAEREGAVTFNRPSPEELADLESACAKEFSTLSRRFEAAKELQKICRMNEAAVISTVEEDAAAEMQFLREGVEEGPIPAWTEDSNRPAPSSVIEQLRYKAEQLKAQLRDAQASLAVAEQRREAAENRLKQRMGSKREGETQTDPAMLSLPGPVERATPSFSDIDSILQPVSEMLISSTF